MQGSTSAQLLHCESSNCLEGESDEEIVPGREDDMKLSDVPEDMREAVQGSWKAKTVGGISSLVWPSQAV